MNLIAFHKIPQAFHQYSPWLNIRGGGAGLNICDRFYSNLHQSIQSATKLLEVKC